MAAPTQDTRSGSPGPDAGAQAWWRRSWVLPLALVLGAFLVVKAVPAVFVDPSVSGLPINRDPAWRALHLALVTAHVLTGSVAYVTAVLQVWPRIRRHHPRVHRWSGRLYVFAGMLPSALLVIASQPLSLLGPIARAGTFFWAVAAFVITATGWWHARRRRWARHRRWMVVSVAIATGVVTDRVVSTVVAAVPGLGFDTETGWIVGQFAAFWSGWTLNTVLALWWLRRSGRPASRPDPPGASTRGGPRPADRPTTHAPDSGTRPVPTTTGAPC